MYHAFKYKTCSIFYFMFTSLASSHGLPASALTLLNESSIDGWLSGDLNFGLCILHYETLATEPPSRGSGYLFVSLLDILK